MFAFQDRRGPVDVAFTDRHGGTSGGPFASLNLSDSTGDSTAAVQHNLDAVAAAFSDDSAAPRLVLMHQVHGADVHVVDGAENHLATAPVADALVTALPDVVLVVRVADCVPVLLADAQAGVLGAAHAGRSGVAAGVVPNAVEAMRALGATQITGWLGPHVCGACYEVPEQLQAEVTSVVPECSARTPAGTPSLDLGAGVTAQLRRDGVEVVDASRCTMEDRDLYSHRRQGGRSGRLAGLVTRRS